MGWSRPLGGWDQLVLLEIGEDLLGGLLGRLALGVDHQLRLLGRLVGVGDARELLDLTGAGLGVEALDVALLADLDRGLDVRLDEAAVHNLPRLVADLAVGRDGGRDDRHAVAGEQVRDERDAADVRVAILLREAEALREVLADDVAVEHLERHAALAQRLDELVGDRGLARAGEAREPEGEALVVAHPIPSLYASIRISATSSRENSCGGLSPASSISRTFVPDRNRWDSCGCGHVFDEPIPSHSWHQNVCSKNSGVIPSSFRSMSSKIRCAS